MSPQLLLAFLAWMLQGAAAELIVGSEALYACATYFETPFDDPDGTVVQVQFLEENAYACGSNIDSFSESQLIGSGEPQALLAFAGNCTLKKKVMLTDRLSKRHPALKFLILIETSARMSGVLDIMLHSQGRVDCQASTKDCGVDTSLTVVSVNRDCGDKLTDYIRIQSNETMSKGGPPVFVFSEQMDSKWQALIQLISLMLFSFSGSFLLGHVLFSRFCPGRRQRSNNVDSLNQSQRCLLTEACVEQFSSPDATKALFERGKNNACDPESDPTEIPSCAVCLETILLPCKVSILPCGHPFHQECIMPWLTERQACCPLCKLALKPTSSYATVSRPSSPVGESESQESQRINPISADDTISPTRLWVSRRGNLPLFLRSRIAAEELSEDLILVEEASTTNVELELMAPTTAAST